MICIGISSEYYISCSNCNSSFYRPLLSAVFLRVLLSFKNRKFQFRVFICPPANFLYSIIFRKIIRNNNLETFPGIILHGKII